MLCTCLKSLSFDFARTRTPPHLLLTFLNFVVMWVYLKEFVSGLHLLSFSFSLNTLSFPFFISLSPLKCQCLTSTSCWLYFTGYQNNGGTGGKDKTRRGGLRGENDDKIYSQYGTVQCLPLCVTAWHFDGDWGKCCMSLNSHGVLTQSLCMANSLMVNWFVGAYLIVCDLIPGSLRNRDGLNSNVNASFWAEELFKRLNGM